MHRQEYLAERTGVDDTLFLIAEAGVTRPNCNPNIERHYFATIGWHPSTHVEKRTLADVRSNSESLTGVWHGLYTGGGGSGHVTFVATLLETASFVSGATHEPRAVGGTTGETLFATLMGTRNSRTVRFTKSYNVADKHYTVVDYEGTLSGDGTEIEGR